MAGLSIFFKCTSTKLFTDCTLIQHSLKSGGTKDHFRWVKVHGTPPPFIERPDTGSCCVSFHSSLILQSYVDTGSCCVSFHSSLILQSYVRLKDIDQIDNRSVICIKLQMYN